MGRRWPSVGASLLLLLSGPLVLSLVMIRAPTWIRAVPVLIYVAVVPGLTCVRLLRFGDHLMEILIGVALSLALGVIVAQTMIYLHIWSLTLWLSILVVIATLATAPQLHSMLQKGHQPRAAPGDPADGNVS